MEWHPLAFERRSQDGAPLLTFTVFVLVHPLVLLWLMRTLAGGLWRRELAAGAVSIAITLVICHFVFAIGEFFFHRYVLHVPALAAVKVFYRKHLQHHSLTSIHVDEQEQRIASRYPVGSVEQDKCGTFPMWAMTALLGGFAPVLLALAWVFPRVPIFLGGIGALTLSYYLYEAVHVMHHRSYEGWWAHRVRRAVTGPAWRALYGFHQAHHANYLCNMNVAGFFGLPVGDWLFATYKQPTALLIDDAPATAALVRSLTPAPRWPVSRLDQRVADSKAGRERGRHGV